MVLVCLFWDPPHIQSRRSLWPILWGDLELRCKIREKGTRLLGLPRFRLENLGPRTQASLEDHESTRSIQNNGGQRLAGSSTSKISYIPSIKDPTNRRHSAVSTCMNHLWDIETDRKVGKDSFENREVGSVPKPKRQGDGQDIPMLDPGMLLLRKAPVMFQKAQNHTLCTSKRFLNFETTSQSPTQPSSSLSRADRVRRSSIPGSAACAQQTSNSRSLCLQASAHGLSSYLYLSIKLIQYSRTQNRKRL
jgi:hypothetical protein